MRRSVAVAAVILLALTGCASKSRRAVPSGFLTDYSQLHPAPKDKRLLVYANENPNLGQYSAFLVEHFEVQLQPESKIKKVPMEELQTLADYFHDAVIAQLQDAYQIVDAPAPDALRVRAAFTDVTGTVPALNIHPATKLTGLGLGGAAFEFECVDSETGERVFAAMVSRKAAKRLGSGLKKWSDAESVLDTWAKQFRVRVDEAHGTTASANAR